MSRWRLPRGRPSGQARRRLLQARRSPLAAAMASRIPRLGTIVIARDVTLEHLWHAAPAFPTFSDVSLHLLEAYGL